MMDSPKTQPFLWGVATSGYQSEGGYNGPGEPLNNWVWAENAGTAAQSGRTADFWNLAGEDFARCKSMGLNAFRLSLEWSRIQPSIVLGDKAGIGESETPPPFDERALYGYAQRLASCRAHGLEPVVTLHHFVQPAWLGVDAWQKASTIEHFLKYVRFTISYLLRVLPHDFGCEPPKWFITINEPNLLAFNTYLYRVFPSGMIGLKATSECLAHLLEAHVRTYRLIHEIFSTTDYQPHVSFNNYVTDLYWSDTAFLDLLCASSRKVPRDKISADLQARAKQFDKGFLKAKLFPFRGPRFFLGQAIKWLHHNIGRGGFRQPCWERLINILYENDKVPLDYIAFDFYDPFVAHALRWPTWDDFEERPRTIKDWVLESVASKWWDWRLLPEGLAHFVQHLGQYGLPLLIAENGMATRRSKDNLHAQRRDSLIRSHYIREHVRVVSRLVEQGHNLIGYLHWSLFDNYEWGSFTPRFGLFSLDYSVYPDRHAVDLGGDNPSATYTLEVKEARERMERAVKRRQTVHTKSFVNGPTLATTPEDSQKPIPNPNTPTDLETIQ